MKKIVTALPKTAALTERSVKVNAAKINAAATRQNVLVKNVATAVRMVNVPTSQICVVKMNVFALNPKMIVSVITVMTAVRTGNALQEKFAAL